MKISKNELANIIKEEAERFVKIKTLEAQKSEIKKQLSENFEMEEMYETENTEEFDSELEEGFFDVFKGSKNIDDAKGLKLCEACKRNEQLNKVFDKKSDSKFKRLLISEKYNRLTLIFLILMLRFC